MPIVNMLKPFTAEAFVQLHPSQKTAVSVGCLHRRQINAHGLLRKTGRPQQSITYIGRRDLVNTFQLQSSAGCSRVQFDYLLLHLSYRNSHYTEHDTLNVQGFGVCRAQKQSEVEASTPVAYLLDYAASLGITKDITKTQAYSVWLQGVK